MNRNPWGRSRNDDFIKDLQALAFWLVIIGVVGYLLFPGFFQDVLGRLRLPAETVTTETTTQTVNLTELPTVFQQVYGGDKLPELSKGYWAVFVRDGQFEQLGLTQDSYLFLSSLIEKDHANGSQKLILAADGQIQQVLVSDEVYAIIEKLSVINDRSGKP